MSPPRSPLGGVAIVRVEVDDEATGRVLLRVITIDDAASAPHDAAADLGAPFGDVASAMEHLRAWLDGWLADRDGGVTDR